MRGMNPLILLFDEAKMVYGNVSSTSLRGHLTSQSREFGLGIIAADQSPHVLGDAIKDNVFTIICLSQSSRKNVNEMAAMLGLNEEQKAYLNHLPVGRGIVKFMDRYTLPFIVDISSREITKDVSTEEALARSKPLIDKLPYKPRVKLFEQGAEITNIQEDSAIMERTEHQKADHDRFGGLPEDEYDYLINLKNHPYLSVADAQRSLRMSAYKGNKLKTSLLEKGYIEEVSFNLGKKSRPKTYLKFTEKAISLVGDQRFDRGRGGFEHKLLAHILRSELTKMGYKAEIEFHHTGKAVDISVYKNGEMIAVEIAMSISGEIDNIRKDLAAGFEKVVVIVMNDALKDKLQKAISLDDDISKNTLAKISIVLISEAMTFF